MRGLQSLIPQKRNDDENEKASPRESVFMIEVEKIHPNPFQPRKEFDESELKDLAASIRQFGVLQPILVTKIEKDTSTGRDVEYELIAGERRWRAAQMANLPRIPVVVRKSTTPEKLAISVIENIQRQNLNPIEEARAYENLRKKFGMSNPQIAQEVGKSVSMIGNMLAILKLPEEFQKALSEKKIHLSHAKFLLTLSSDPEKQRKLFDEIVNNTLDKLSAEARLWELKKADAPPALRASGVRENPELVAIADKLRNRWELKGIKVNRFGAKTRVFIEFATQKELEDWANRIVGA